MAADFDLYIEIWFQIFVLPTDISNNAKVFYFKFKSLFLFCIDDVICKEEIALFLSINFIHINIVVWYLLLNIFLPALIWSKESHFFINQSFKRQFLYSNIIAKCPLCILLPNVCDWQRYIIYGLIYQIQFQPVQTHIIYSHSFIVT